MRVLLIEDDTATAQSIELMLKSEGFNVYTTDLGEEGVDLGKLYDYDIILLDLNLPDMSGFEVLRALRVSKVKTPILILSGLAGTEDKVRGLGFGADDYMTKPFHKDELVARIHVMLRRPRTTADETSQQVRVFGDLRIDPEAREVTLAGQPVSLTRTEFDILDVLSAHPRRVHSRALLVEDVWGQGWVGDERIVDVHVAHLRAKLGDASSEPAYIRTVRGVGFRMGDG